MKTTPDRIAQGALLSMLLELSSTPKPGNVDRSHDFEEIKFHHFLISALSAYPVFRDAALGGEPTGALILRAVSAWRGWGLSQNTHFGTIALLIPLAKAAGRGGDLREEAVRVLEETTVEDAVEFYAAFRIAGARVAEVEDLSLQDPASKDRLLSEKRTLLDLMRLSSGHDLVAREWSTGFERSFSISRILAEKVADLGINDGVVISYIEALAEVPDGLVASKFGAAKAVEVSERARSILGGEVSETLRLAGKLDDEFIEEDVNPGSTADLIAAALFIALMEGAILRSEEG
ncbi:triphosphoribosyl-dephospho-CoA synthase [Candidatus Methanocrinis natronophilus]|uniref:Triphosphoribosyl-dephospho-CoA synthase n=1 Tax=Candidatus Methanocrinis natronophilus TaxID=3033396 RepID=A0ABT5X780_9EURY|nr:triphosphoribosyl-dephospho-CoA synthase [Candidatus Methanocrinis natronophilus]MDF0590541.1 triphosphoribosyl-dephospho-CoA synthase [Candidatus Methanocrinis natronophilus]